ncbi:glycoside hydrolase family 5 protein [Desulfovibrio inopinatus]|uniref:glycoside hydrolase family 5 protein n=1 Tax=Desulfovibrio inopinatus TaxID=102109 RepID=UPI0004004581|nr:cellulase family glycosylhydrolase [Desulfovibrio inopinatus]
MKVKYTILMGVALFFVVTIGSSLCHGQTISDRQVATLESLSPEMKISFWGHQRKGANGCIEQNSAEWFKAASDAGIEFVRLCPVKLKPHGRDFLLGDADNFTDIPKEDFSRLKNVLDTAARYNVRIVLTMFSLPGARWRQQNKEKFDYRLWTQEKYQQQAVAFWKKLAAKLKDHPAIVGYNPLNEPYPARKDGFSNENHEGFGSWLKQHLGTASDLNRFNRRIVEAIRSEDPHTPIILDGWFHAAAQGIKYLVPVADNAVLYAFHFYYPWNYTTFRVNKGRFSYPEKMPTDSNGKIKAWDNSSIKQQIQPVIEWADRFAIPPSQIIVEEFGCDRRVHGAKSYLHDIIAAFNENKWHWAFYSFRSSDWDGMDYELGTKKLGWNYWKKREEGASHEQLVKRHDNPLWSVFKHEFAQ